MAFRWISRIETKQNQTRYSRAAMNRIDSINLWNAIDPIYTREKERERECRVQLDLLIFSTLNIYLKSSYNEFSSHWDDLVQFVCSTNDVQYNNSKMPFGRRSPLETLALPGVILAYKYNQFRQKKTWGSQSSCHGTWTIRSTSKNRTYRPTHAISLCLTLTHTHTWMKVSLENGKGYRVDVRRNLILLHWQFDTADTFRNAFHSKRSKRKNRTLPKLL